jgi:hypothetical protein
VDWRGVGRGWEWLQAKSEGVSLGEGDLGAMYWFGRFGCVSVAKCLDTPGFLQGESNKRVDSFLVQWSSNVGEHNHGQGRLGSSSSLSVGGKFVSSCQHLYDSLEPPRSIPIEIPACDKEPIYYLCLEESLLALSTKTLES